MTTSTAAESASAPSASPVPTAGHPADSVTARPPRLWPAVLILALFWTFTFVARQLDLITFVRFVSSMAASALVVLAYLIWWSANGRISRTNRLLGIVITIAGGVAAAAVCDKSYGPFGLMMFALPCVLTTATLWMLAARQIPALRRGWVGTFVVFATWGYFPLIRMDGIDGEQRAAVHWRWTPSAEELFLAERNKGRTAAADQAVADADRESIGAVAYELQSDDWPGFRGPNRDGVVRGLRINTDWAGAPPKQVWKQRVGPAWSSMAIVADRLFTQEQRGEFEAVVCLDAATGREIWSHEDKARFWDTVSGAGPRATPAFDGGRIYALGGTGILNCLDAASGKLVWTRNVAAESGAAVPGWGFSGSPLVAKGFVIAFAGGPGDKALLAYRADSGEPVWSAPAGQGSYSSPQLVSLGGQQQVLILSDGGLFAFEPVSGKPLWNFGTPTPGAPLSLQPHVMNDSQVVVTSPADFGLALVDLSQANDAWQATRHWGSSEIHPSFNDFVVCKGHAFGFNEAIFACLDLENGKRRWKKGRYGHGQVVLLAEQELLIVLAETGEVVLLAANPEKLDELGRFQAIEGKTWNHPAIAHGRLFVRNGEQMACYELPTRTASPGGE